MKKYAMSVILLVFLTTCFSGKGFAEFYVISVQKKCGICEGTSSAGGRWCDNGDGTVTDMTTCLVWLKYASWGGAKKWRNDASCDECYDDAHSRAGTLENGDIIFQSGETTVYLSDGSIAGDWRLATKNELSNIINEGGETVYSSNPQLFNDVKSAYYWTDTTVENTPSYAHRVHMVTGAETSTPKEGSLYVWPVRDAK